MKISVLGNYMVLKIGMLRFYLCIKSLPNEDEKDYDEEKPDDKNDLQLRGTHEEVSRFG